MARGMSARHTQHVYSLMVLLYLLIFLGFSCVVAQPAVVQYQDCFSGPSTSQKLNISTVYAQFIPQNGGRGRLNFTLIGTTPQTIIPSSNDSNNPVASKSRQLAPL